MTWNTKRDIAVAPGRGPLTPAVALLLALALAVGGCREAGSAPGSASRSGQEAPSGHAQEMHADHAEHPAAGEASGHSIYHLSGTWLDQDGREVTLSDLGGRIQVVALVYTHCGYACPRILAQMKRIEGEVVDRAPGEVGFTLVSIDPERDRPARLKKFAEKSRLAPERWTLLNGSDPEILGLSVLLGVKYRATGDGEFAHSNVITILDRNGVPTHRIEGLGADLEPAVRAIHGLLDRGPER